MSKQYVDNAKLYDDMVRWKQDLAVDPHAPMPEAIGEAIFTIADHLSKKPSFVNYSWREDMVADAMLNCTKYLHSFNPDKTKNPFAYVTQIVKNSFYRSISNEKTFTYRNMLVSGELDPTQRQYNAEHEGYQQWINKRAAENDERKRLRPPKPKRPKQKSNTGVKNVYRTASATYTVRIRGKYCGIYPTVEEARMHRDAVLFGGAASAVA